MFDEYITRFFKSENLISAIKALEINLEVPNQIKNYDRIYKQFVGQNQQILNSFFDERTIVKGLNFPVILAVLGAHYRQLLYPKIRFTNFRIIDEILYMILTNNDVINDNISIADFKIYIAKILRVISEGNITNLIDPYNVTSTETSIIPYFELPDNGIKIQEVNVANNAGDYGRKNVLRNLNKAFLPYILIGNENDEIKLLDLADFMFEDSQIFKLVVNANLHPVQCNDIKRSRLENQLSRNPFRMLEPYDVYMEFLKHNSEIVKNSVDNYQKVNSFSNIYNNIRKSGKKREKGEPISSEVTFIYWSEISKYKNNKK